MSNRDGNGEGEAAGLALPKRLLNKSAVAKLLYTTPVILPAASCVHNLVEKARNRFSNGGTKVTRACTISIHAYVAGGKMPTRTAGVKQGQYRHHVSDSLTPCKHKTQAHFLHAIDSIKTREKAATSASQLHRNMHVSICSYICTPVESPNRASLTCTWLAAPSAP